MRFIRALHLCQTLLVVALTGSIEVLSSTLVSAEPSPWFWDALEKSSELPVATNIAHFTFWVTNNSAADAILLATVTSCDCTVAEAAQKLPWRLASGESGALNVNVNTLGQFGLVTKTVTVQTSHGSQVLTIRVKIPLTPAPFNISARQRDVMAAQADRQSVFRDHCAACHTWPALGQTGQTLYEKACGICHEAEHRAEMVPKLVWVSRGADADFWRKIITFGKPGSLMPAFAKSEGGILDTNQIESLVEHLLTTYPATNSHSMRE